MFEFDYDYDHDMTNEEYFTLLRTAPLGFFKNFQINHLIKILYKNGVLNEEETKKLLVMQ